MPRLSLVRDIGIDLGTVNTLVHVQGRGIVIREPSVVALERGSGRPLAVGLEAQKMLGRTPGHVVAIHPLRDGVIADDRATLAMLRHFLQRAVGRAALLKPRVVVCVPSGVTTIERRAVVACALEAGARHAYLIEEPLAAALGAGLDLDDPAGAMVLDIGGGTSDAAVLSFGGIVLSRSLRTGGNRLDDAVIRYVKDRWKVLLGEPTAERLKIGIGTVDPAAERGTMEVRGRDLITGLPRTLELGSAHVRDAIAEPVSEIVDLVTRVLERTPPELAGDVVDRGLVLTGGGALLHGLDRLLVQQTGVPVLVPDDPLLCVALGTGIALKNFASLDHLLAIGPEMGSE